MTFVRIQKKAAFGIPSAAFFAAFMPFVPTASS